MFRCLAKSRKYRNKVSWPEFAVTSNCVGWSDCVICCLCCGYINVPMLRSSMFIHLHSKYGKGFLNEFNLY